jgi:ketosteroid isomerase-like protein
MNCVHARRSALRIYAMLAIFAMLGFCATPSNAQQKDKKKKKDTAPIVDNSSANPIVPLTDEQQIDYMISEVLGAWQIGDSDRMHKNYSEDISVVNGGWAPPVIGWANYEPLYKQQRAKMQQVRMDRSNTYIKVNGNTAWACFQWEFAAVIDGNPSAARGQTTYVFIKKDNRWLVAHDHTSVVQTAQPQPPGGTAPAGTALPAKPAN